MTKDTGFGDGAVSVTDVLQVSDGEDASRSSTPSSHHRLKISSFPPKCTYADSSTTPLDSQYYDIVFSMMELAIQLQISPHKLMMRKKLSTL